MSGLFRKEAVENHSSGKDSALAVRAIPIRWVVYIIIISLCAASFVIWLLFGTVYESVTLRGVAWPWKSNGDVYSETSGVLAKTTASVGDYVEAGDIIAVIPNNEVLENGNNGGEGEVYNEYDRTSVIRSKVSGIVTYIKDRNAYVNPGDKVATVITYAKNGNNDIITAFVPDVWSSLVSVGTEVHVMPDDTNREQDGYVLGYVSAISDYPVTGEQVNTTYSHLYMSNMSLEESYTEIQITMMRSSDNDGRLKWSKPSGENKIVNFGTRCDVELILHKYKPYRWLLRWEQ